MQGSALPKEVKLVKQQLQDPIFDNLSEFFRVKKHEGVIVVVTHSEGAVKQKCWRNLLSAACLSA